MKFHKNKLLTTGAAVALALAVGACSSSGDDDEMAGTTPPANMAGTTPPATTEPAPDPTPAEQLAAANTALETAQALVGALTPSSTPEEAADAYTALGTAQAAVHAATNLPENQIAALQARVDQLVLDLDAANMVAMQAASVKAALATATTMVDGLTDDSDDAAVTAARGAVTAAQAALTGAADLPQDVSDNLGTLISSLDSRLLVAETEVASRPTEAGVAAAMAATTAAGTKTEAIAEETAQTAPDDDRGLGGSAVDPNNAAQTYTATISRGRDGRTVEIADPRVAGDDDPKFVDQMAGLDRGRTMLVREMEADDDGNVVEEVVIVSTDIEAPKATAFAKVAGQAPNVDLDTTMDADDDGTAENDLTALSLGVDANTAPMASVLELVMSDAFVPGSGTSTELTFARYQLDSDGSADGNQTIQAFTTPGTYNGAMGTYMCNGASDDCMATVNAKGEITAMTAGWVFTPADGATSDVADADYLHYGFWLMKTTDEDGVLTYNEVETFAAATGPGYPETGDSDLAGVVGSATYEGGAVGVYVKNVLDDQANITSATSGHFVADVELNANFGGDGVAANDQFTIGGTITDFVLQHGEENDWAVGLLADFTERTGMPGMSPPGSSHNNEFSGVATGDSTAAAGSWNGVFYGSSAQVDHDMDSDTLMIRRQPVAVIGEFNANFTDGTAAGGFGANK